MTVLDELLDSPEIPAFPEKPESTQTGEPAPALNLPPGPAKIIKFIQTGLLHGTYVPKDAPKPAVEVQPIPDQLVENGVGIYRPRDPKALLVLYNPLKITEAMLRRLDDTGKITKVFPPVTKWLTPKDLGLPEDTPLTPEEEPPSDESPDSQTESSESNPDLASPLPAILNTPKQKRRAQVSPRRAKSEPPLSQLTGSGGVIL